METHTFGSTTARPKRRSALIAVLACILMAWIAWAANAGLQQPENTWVKRSPAADTPPSPRLGYEGACAWDNMHRLLIRYGGHNQGGGGEQGSEIWTFDPISARWELKQPNTSPPGVCCAQQNVFDPIRGRYVRFPAFSGSHGWQWWREIYLNNSTVWTYSLETNSWRDMRPLPAPRVSPLRCASWDSDAQVIVLFGGEGNREGTVVYDPYTNTWTKMDPPTQPPFRSAGNMVYDAAHRRHILFGSQFSDEPQMWSYDLRGNEWTDLRPAALPPTDRNDAVMAYDSRNQIVVAIVKVTKGEEEASHQLQTWAFEPAENTWTKMNPPQEPDPSGNRTRVLCFAPELGLTILEDCTHPPQAPREQQIWTYRSTNPNLKPSRLPEPPTDIQVKTFADGAVLRWKATPSAPASSYEIYRGNAENPWSVDFKRIAGIDPGQTTYQDKGLTPGSIYYYTIRAKRDGQLSPESVKVRTQPPIVEDVVVSVTSEGRVELRWAAPQGDDIVGYRVERAQVDVWSEDQLKRLKTRLKPLPQPAVGAIRRVGPFTRLTAEAVRETTFVDAVNLILRQELKETPIWESGLFQEHLDPQGAPHRFAVFAYRVRAVNALGVEGGPSPFFLTIPSAPQWLFSKEEGTACHLKWEKNPEKNLKGYRVYRLDGRWDSDSISRLTELTISELTFRDDTVGKNTRRYHVVAVDALGQEGLPSAPVWFDREWKRFYEPFTTEWHQ